MMLNVHTLVVAAVVWASLISAVLAFSAADYNTALGKSLLFYDLQRSGRLPRWQRLRWRGNSAMNDGRSQGVSKHTNFSIFNDRSGEPIMQIIGDDIDLFWMLSFFFCFWSVFVQMPADEELQCMCVRHWVKWLVMFLECRST